MPSLQGGAIELASYCNAVAAGLQVVFFVCWIQGGQETILRVRS